MNVPHQRILFHYCIPNMKISKNIKVLYKAGNNNTYTRQSKKVQPSLLAQTCIPATARRIFIH